MKNHKNEILQKLIILEEFMQNGLQNRNQRIFVYVGNDVSKLSFDIKRKMIFDIEISLVDIKSIKNSMI